MDLLFPVLVTLMFGALFGGAIAGPNGDYYSYLMPGIFTMAMLFGLEVDDDRRQRRRRRGVTDRFRSLPINAAAVLLGRCIADMIGSVAGLAVLVVTGLALGWRWEHGIGAALTAFGTAAPAAVRPALGRHLHRPRGAAAPRPSGPCRSWCGP